MIYKEKSLKLSGVPNLLHTTVFGAETAFLELPCSITVIIIIVINLSNLCYLCLTCICIGVTVTEDKDTDEVTLNCSLLTYEDCRHTVKWLLNGYNVDRTNNLTERSQTDCFTTV